MDASLYLHVPFCAKKCAYCDFESYAGKTGYADEYIDNVIKEARVHKQVYGCLNVPTVFVGGGTPSMLTSEQLKRLLGGVFDVFPPRCGAEITIEANPGTVDAAKLKAMAACGVNRLSFGAQAYQSRLLNMLGRIHNWEDVSRAVFAARESGISNINIDIMYAFPGQTLNELVQSVEEALALKPTHISCYSLILEEGTPLAQRVRQGELEYPNDDAVIQMQRSATRILAEAGLNRYEISNYAKQGCECRHNTVYWTGENYLGLGCAAHSLMELKRFSNPCFDEYMEGKFAVDVCALNTDDIMEEAVMLRTRLARGIDLTRFERTFGAENLNRLINEGKRLEQGGFTELSSAALALTERGMEVHDAVVLRLLEALEK